MQHLAFCCLIIAACGGNKASNIDAPAGTIDAPGMGTDAPPGSNTITGMIGGTNFNTVAATYWIGKPDSPMTDTVIYMFDRAVACNQMTLAGWDAALTAGTQILEMKMVGMTPMVYPQTTAATGIPAAGESYSGYTVAMPTATDSGAKSGSVTLTMLGTPAASGFAIGTFALTWANGSLTGKYDAPYCSTGREP